MLTNEHYFELAWRTACQGKNIQIQNYKTHAFAVQEKDKLISIAPKESWVGENVIYPTIRLVVKTVL